MRGLIKKLSVITGVFIFVLCAGFVNAQRYTNPCLIVVSQGSNDAEANAKVDALIQQVYVANNAAGTPFNTIESATLGAGKKTLKAAVDKMEANFCDVIAVVPFFTSQDKYTQKDIPAVMGLNKDAAVLEELKKAGIEVAAPTVPVFVTKTLNETPAIADFIKSEVAYLSQKGADEALVVIGLEANDYKDRVSATIGAATKAGAASKGIKLYKDTYSWQDETFFTNVAPVIKDFSAKKKRVIVVSVYTTIPAQDFYLNSSKAALDKGIDSSSESLGKTHLVLSRNSLVDYNGTAKAIVALGKGVLPK